MDTGHMITVLSSEPRFKESLAEKVLIYWRLRSAMIASGLKPGKHVLHCEVVAETNDPVSGGHEFRITSVTT